jgi:predicted DNA-binding protein (UPF0251 family)
MRGRKRRARCIAFDPAYTCFKPCGRPGRGMETVEVRADEFEALRLMDYEGLYQAECAERMGISRPTLSHTVASARRKVADALLHGKRLVIASAPPAVLATSRDYESAADSDVELPNPAQPGGPATRKRWRGLSSGSRQEASAVRTMSRRRDRQSDSV